MLTTRSTITVLALTLLTGAVQAATLYDPGLGTLPTAQGWTAQGVGAAPARVFSGASLRTDTLTDSAVDQFVDYRSAPASVPLDTVAGFTLSFDLRVVSEAHQSQNRSGFQVLLQGLDQSKALELCFWDNEVWALSHVPGGADSGLVHGNGALLDTTAGVRTYALTVQSNAYTLRVDGNPVLSGNMTDYPVLGASTLAYGTSNMLFFGDDSTRGQAITELGVVSLSAVPEPAPTALLLAGLAMLGWRARQRGTGRG